MLERTQAWLDTNLVSDWRESPKWASIWGNAARTGLAVLATVQASPDLLLELVPFLPPGWVQVSVVVAVILVMFVLPTVERLWNQGKRDDKPEQ